MSPPSLFERAEAEREALRDSINFLQTQLTDHQTTPLSEVEVDTYLEQSASAEKEVMDNQRTLRITAPKTTNMDPYVGEFNALLAQAVRVHSGYHGIKKRFPPSSTPSSSSSIASAHHQTIKLPRLELPKFSGNLQEWVSFRDLFINAVHNSTLNKVDKFTQLKSLLTGEAARQIRSLVLSDANYDIAWKSLQDRYENNRELLFSILRRLFSQQQVPANNSSELRSLIDTTKECVRSLEVLSLPTQHWDGVLIYTLFTKLDPTSRELWEQSLTDSEIPALSKMFEFLEQRARALAAGAPQPFRQTKLHQEAKPQRVMMNQASSSNCILGCENPHPLYKCSSFRNKTPQQRFDFLKKNNLCFNCLAEGHTTSDCTNQHTRKTCSRKHHSMVHLAPSSAAQPHHVRDEQGETNPIVESHLTTIKPHSQEIATAILATAVVKVVSNSGFDIMSRAFLDPGSTVTLITISFARRLQLHLHNSNIQITGLGSSQVGESPATTSLQQPRFNSSTTIPVTALVVKEISKQMPGTTLKHINWSHLNDLQLADPEYYNPSTVDILFGGDIFWSILGGEKKYGQSGGSIAVNSSLGWLVAGPQVQSTHPSLSSSSITHAELDISLQKFWECETFPNPPKISEEEEPVENNFFATHKRDQKGLIIVSIPWKAPPSELGSLRKLAVQSLLPLRASETSQKAMSACVYIPCEYTHQHLTTHLFTSKTRVAPIKFETPPRLELNAAVLLSELLQTTIRAVKKNIDKVRFYTDSTITLHWMNSNPSRWKIYVRNRVQHIQQNTPVATWFHIAGTCNPADCASRGISAKELLYYRLQKEIHPVETHHADVISLPTVFYKYSTFNRLQRVATWILRYYQNKLRKMKGTPLQQGPLNTYILKETHNLIIRKLQNYAFPNEVKAINQNKEIAFNSSLLPLCPFLCPQGLMRVGGRLENAAVPFNQKHPILLPKKHLITNNIIQDSHLRYLHAGPSSLLSILNQHYWVVRGREAVRWCVKRYVTCTRHQSLSTKQLIGDLPLHRVNPSRPFSKVDIDYAGYFSIRPQGRSKVLKDFSNLSKSNDVITDCTSQGIQWHFNPPGAPHFGGLWEAGVRSITHHLSRVFGESLLTFEEMLTLVCQIEAILNSRPIIPASADPNDLTALTPAHFLVGSSLVSVPEPDHLDTKINRLQRWELIQQRQQLFWKRWSNEFIIRIQQRPKWCRVIESLKVGQLVIVKDERLPPLKWKLGRVLCVHPGADGHVRVAIIKTADGEFKRPVVKLCLLPISDTDNES